MRSFSTARPLNTHLWDRHLAATPPPEDLISQLDSWPACAPVNASPASLRPRRMTRGQDDWLGLSRATLPFATLRRSSRRTDWPAPPNRRRRPTDRTQRGPAPLSAPRVQSGSPYESASRAFPDHGVDDPHAFCPATIRRLAQVPSAAPPCRRDSPAGAQHVLRMARLPSVRQQRLRIRLTRHSTAATRPAGTSRTPGDVASLPRGS